MMNSKNRLKIVLGYFLITCLSLIIVFFSVYSMKEVCNESDFIIKKILPAKIFSGDILTSLLNQETGVRAYIISGNKEFLQSYYLGDSQMQGYYNSLNNLKNTTVGINTTNQLNTQMKVIQTFFREQITLVGSGNSYEAKLNLNKGNTLVEGFRIADNTLINKIDLEVNASRNKVLIAQKTQRYLLFFLGAVLILSNIIFIRYIWNYMYSEIKKRNEINKELQKLVISQEAFISNISHELKTPLNVIFSAAQLFEMYCQTGSLDDKRETIIKYVGSIKLNSYRLSKLINNIVDSSKIEAGFFEMNLSNNDIVEAVEDIVTSVSSFVHEKGLSIIFDTKLDEKIIAYDPEKIERSILNLLSNALKFSNSGDEIFVDVEEKDEYIEISVKDNGIGIKKENLDKIFSRFKQLDESLSRNAEGTGIGLSLVKSIIELHGGSISVESVFGKGSKFLIKLPSVKVFEEDSVYVDKMKSKTEIVQIELSDIYSY